MRSIRQNIWKAVLKYGPNEVRSVGKTKVPIFSRMDRINWSIRALLYSHNQRPKHSLNSELNIFVSTLNAAVGKQIFPIPLSRLKNKALIKKNLRENFCRPFCLFIEECFQFPGPLRLFAGPIRLWTYR